MWYVNVVKGESFHSSMIIVVNGFLAFLHIVYSREEYLLETVLERNKLERQMYTSLLASPYVMQVIVSLLEFLRKIIEHTTHLLALSNFCFFWFTYCILFEIQNQLENELNHISYVKKPLSLPFVSIKCNRTFMIFMGTVFLQFFLIRMKKCLP